MFNSVPLVVSGLQLLLNVLTADSSKFRMKLKTLRLFSFCRGMRTRLDINCWQISASVEILLLLKINATVFKETSGKHRWKNATIWF